MSVIDNHRRGITILGAMQKRPGQKAPQRGPLKKGVKATAKAFRGGSGLAKLRTAPTRAAKFQGRRAYDGAVTALKHLSKIAKKTAAKAASYKASQHKTLLPAQKIGGKLVVGPNHHLTAAQQRAVNKHTKALIAHHNAVMAAARAAQIAAAKGKALTAEVAKQWKILSKFEPRVAKHVKHMTTLHGDPEMVAALDAALETALLGDLASDDDDMTASDNYAGYGGAYLDVLGEGEESEGESETAAPYAEGGGESAWGEAAADLASAPEPPDAPLIPYGGTLSKADAGMVHHRVPDDGVVYDGSYGWKDWSKGSYSWFADGLAARGDGVDPWPLAADAHGPKMGYIWTTRGTRDSVDQSTPRWMAQMGNGDDQVHDVDSQADDVIANLSLHNTTPGLWGPIISNPDPGEYADNPSASLAGLQYAVDDKAWFWLPGNAPAWAVSEQNAAITLLNKKKHEAWVAAQAAQAAAMAQEKAAEAEAQAKQDAQNALAQSAADTQAGIAQQQQATQQGQIDLQQQQQDQQQAAWQAQTDYQQQQVAIAQAQAQQQYAQQMAQLQAKAAQADLDYMIAHPEAAAEQGGGEGEGGGEAEQGYGEEGGGESEAAYAAEGEGEAEGEAEAEPDAVEGDPEYEHSIKRFRRKRGW